MAPWNDQNAIEDFRAFHPTQSLQLDRTYIVLYLCPACVVEASPAMVQFRDLISLFAQDVSLLDILPQLLSYSEAVYDVMQIGPRFKTKGTNRWNLLQHHVRQLQADAILGTSMRTSRLAGWFGYSAAFVSVLQRGVQAESQASTIVFTPQTLRPRAVRTVGVQPASPLLPQIVVTSPLFTSFEYMDVRLPMSTPGSLSCCARIRLCTLPLCTELQTLLMC